MPGHTWTLSPGSPQPGQVLRWDSTPVDQTPLSQQLHSHLSTHTASLEPLNRAVILQDSLAHHRAPAINAPGWLLGSPHYAVEGEAPCTLGPNWAVWGLPRGNMEADTGVPGTGTLHQRGRQVVEDRLLTALGVGWDGR